MRRFSVSFRIVPARVLLFRIATVALFGVAAGYAAAARHIVFVARIGPVASELNAAAGIGIHTGDVLAIPLFVLAALTVVFGVGFLHAADEHAVVRRGLAHRR